MRISHSSKELYLRCPAAWHIQNNLRLFRKQVGSALPFGVAIDEGLNHLLLTGNIIESNQIFKTKWLKPTINDVVEDIFTTKNIRFSKADADTSVLSEERIRSLKTEQEITATAILEKGMMMIEQYAEQILPTIRKVYAVQEKIDLDNGVGDYITGLVDFVAEFKDGSVRICDNKTTSKSYKPDVIQTESQQLATYQEAIGTKYGVNEVAYITINKTVRKIKQPRVDIQVIKGIIPEELKEKTFEQFNNVIYNIKMGNFKSNHPNCFMYGEQCTCVKFLESNGTSNEGLIHVERKNR